jgi:hypothetical protein
MSWKDTIPNCFEADGDEFGRRWIQEAAAKALILRAKSQGATFQDLEREIVWFCYDHVKAPGQLQSHIAHQVERAHALW